MAPIITAEQYPHPLFFLNLYINEFSYDPIFLKMLMIKFSVLVHLFINYI